MRVAPAPISPELLCLYIAYLARTLKASSVPLYLNFVSLLHKELGLPDPVLGNWLISSTLTGVRRLKGSPPVPKLPITIDMLVSIRTRLNLSLSLHASFWAICLTAFFGLFRKSHLLPISSGKFSVALHFCKDDFIPFSGGYLVRVRWSKTIQFHQRVVFIPLVRIPSSPLCPVAAISQALALCASDPPQAAAFTWRDSAGPSSRVFTYRRFMRLFRLFLSQAGYEASAFGTHSFRRGGATLALQAGIPISTIQLLGDWKSDAVLLYLTLPVQSRVSAQVSISNHITHLTF